MSAEILLAFVAACVLLALTPGPNMALMIANTLSNGLRAGLVTLAGTTTGLALLVAAAAAGMMHQNAISVRSQAVIVSSMKSLFVQIQQGRRVGKGAVGMRGPTRRMAQHRAHAFLLHAPSHCAWARRCAVPVAMQCMWTAPLPTLRAPIKIGR